MAQERIQTRYTLNGPLASHAELEQAITRAIEAHKQDFFPCWSGWWMWVTAGSSSVRRTRCGYWGGTRRG